MGYQAGDDDQLQLIPRRDLIFMAEVELLANELIYMNAQGWWYKASLLGRKGCGCRPEEALLISPVVDVGSLLQLL